MALINKLDNAASVIFDGDTINSNSVSTLLLLPPTLLKAVDKLTASVGDIVTYTVTVTNLGLSAITNLPFTDALPEGSVYLADSFQLNGSPVTPTVTGNVLTYTISNIGALGVATLQFQVTVVGGSTP